MGQVKEIYKNDQLGRWIACNPIGLQDLLKESKYQDISFITLEGQKKIESDEIKGFCHAKFKANIVIDSLQTQMLKPTDKLFIGNSIVEIIEVGKNCHKRCPILEQTDGCSIGKHIFFAKILKDGIVQYNDIVGLI